MKELNFVLDIGNTHIVLGVFDGNNILHSWRISADVKKTEDEYFGIIHNLFKVAEIQQQTIVKVAISSVVPSLGRVFSHLLQKYFPKTKLINVTANTKLGLKFPMKNSSFVGADLVVNAYAAKEIYKTNCIICDLGSATTIQLVGKDGYFYGTAIIPGVLTSAKNLFETASQLTNIKLEIPNKILGVTTHEALNSGIVYGNAFMLDKFISEIKNNFKKLDEIKAIATGGISELICDKSTEIDVIDKYLTLTGLNLICSEK